MSPRLVAPVVVGRAAELGAIDAAFARASAEEPAVVLLPDRQLAPLASGGMGVALTLLVVTLHIHNVSPVLMLVSILLYVAFFALGMGPGPWLIISEIFPTKVRGRAASIATSTLWSGTLLVTFTFLSLVKVLNLWGTFAIYGSLSFVCLIYVWKMVPETKGRTLEHIQEDWGK